MNFVGTCKIFIIFCITLIITVIIATNVLIIILLNVNIYKVIPTKSPKNINNLRFPPENLYIKNIMLIPVNIQNIISSIFNHDLISYIFPY